MLDTRHESESETSDELEDERGSEAGETIDLRQVAHAGAMYSGGSRSTLWQRCHFHPQRVRDVSVGRT